MRQFTAFDGELHCASRYKMVLRTVLRHQKAINKPKTIGARLAYLVQNRAHVRASATLLMLLLLVACGEPKQEGGNPARGKAAIERYGCNACHVIPGVPGPKGMVGPTLDHMAARPTIAGKLPNNSQTMIKWLQNPPAFDPQSSMPNMGITESESRDIAAYLYTLK